MANWCYTFTPERSVCGRVTGRDAPGGYPSRKEVRLSMPSDRKWRKKKMAKHKHRKLLKKTRWQRREKK
jgi:hypothetical protein